MRVSFVGKGGAGKSTLAALLCRIAAEQGDAVLALDADHAPGLACVLGIPAGDEWLLTDAYEFKEGTPLNAKMSQTEMISRFALKGPYGIRFLQYGKVTSLLELSHLASLSAFQHIAMGFDEPDAWVVADLYAGTLQPAVGYTGNTGAALIVAESSQKSLLTARRIAPILMGFPNAKVLGVASKVASEKDVQLIEKEFDRVGVPLWSVVPADPAVTEAELKGEPLVNLNSETVIFKEVLSMVHRLRSEFMPGRRQPEAATKQPVQ